MKKKEIITEAFNELFFGKRDKPAFLTQGMLNCIRHAARGRTEPLYETAEEMAEGIVDYFLECDKNDGKITITGLAMHLGYKTRQSFYDNRSNEKFGPVLEAAHQAIEHYYEKKLTEPGQAAAGPIFALKQFEWKDTQDITNNVTATISSEPLSPEEWAEQYAPGGNE